MANNYGFTFGELDTSTANDGYGGLLIKFLNTVGSHASGSKQPALLFEMRSSNNPIDWHSNMISPLLVNGKGLAINSDQAAPVGLYVRTKDAVRIPVGTTANRPTGANGYIRYNTTIDDYEGYKESEWTSLTSGGSEVSLNTSSYDYLSISSGTITLGQIDISDDTNLVAGTGLTLSGDTLNVDAAQSGITSIGTLTNLLVSSNMGIGITTPRDSLHIDKNMRLGKNGIIWAASGTHDHSGSLTLRAGGNGTDSGNVHGWHAGAGGELKIGGQWNDGYLEYKHADVSRFIINHSGYVGIGTTDPKFSLHIVGGGLGNNGTINDTSTYYVGHDGFGVNNLPPTSSGHNFATASYQFSLYCTKSIFSERYIAASDSRIKDNIEDIPNDTALQMVRDIPCRYYTYRDVVSRGNNRTIGFIAQEVKDVIPEAVNVISEYIPDEYRLLTDSNKTWTMVNGSYNLIIGDLSTTTNSSYRFIVGDGDIDEHTIDISSNGDGSFTFEKQWNKIFLYGSLVNDLQALDNKKYLRFIMRLYKN